MPVSKVKKTVVKKAKAAPKAKAKTKRKPNPFMVPPTPSAALAEVVGANLKGVKAWINPKHKDRRTFHANRDGTFAVAGRTLNLGI